MAYRVAVIGCGASKRTEDSRAEELYTSTLFQLSWAYARTFDRWWIASAKFGLLEPSKVIAPYEAKLGPKDGTIWGRCVANSIVGELLPSKAFRKETMTPAEASELYHRDAAAFPLDVEVVLLCGETYANPIATALVDRVHAVSRPLEGLGLGKRMQWLKAATARVAA